MKKCSNYSVISTEYAVSTEADLLIFLPCESKGQVYFVGYLRGNSSMIDLLCSAGDMDRRMMQMTVKDVLQTKNECLCSDCIKWYTIAKIRMRQVLFHRKNKLFSANFSVRLQDDFCADRYSAECNPHRDMRRAFFRDDYKGVPTTVFSDKLKNQYENNGIMHFLYRSKKQNKCQRCGIRKKKSRSEMRYHAVPLCHIKKGGVSYL